MALSRVQAKNATANGGSSVTLVFDATPTNGNLLVATISYRGTSITAVDTAWTKLTEAVIVSGRQMAIWWKAATAGESNSYVWNISGTTRAALVASEWSATAGWLASPVDVENSQTTASGTTHTTPTVTPASGVERLVILGFGLDNNGSSWSNETVNGSSTGVSEDGDVASGGASGVTTAQASLAVTSTSGSYYGDATSAATAAGGAAIAIFSPVAAGLPPGLGPDRHMESFTQSFGAMLRY